MGWGQKGSVFVWSIDWVCMPERAAVCVGFVSVGNMNCVYKYISMKCSFESMKKILFATHALVS